ncbi:MAG: LysR family transcriptional regulator [Planctomycetota bacterium]|nr:LysR family transcriptional regulator [Planctomycetota bacterium]
MKYTKEQLDAHMRELASPKQLAYMDAVKKHGSIRAAARALGLGGPAAISRSLKRLRVKVSERKVEPHRDPDDIAEGQRIKGVSATQYVLDPESGKYRMMWVKTERDPNAAERKDVFEAMHELLAGFNATTPEPAPRPLKRASDRRDDLMVVIPIGDFHFGMYAWGAECGEDYNLAIAEQNWRAAFDEIVDTIPRTSLGVLLNLGDLTHGDNSKNVTPRSGHQLDMDTRHPKVTAVALRCMLYAATRLREKCDRVIVRNNIGNHDTETSQHISLMMEAHFNGIEIPGLETKPDKPASRVEILCSPKDLMVVAEFGNVMITSSHGEYTKPHEIPGLLMDDFGGVVGRCSKRYHHSGHVHHRQRWGDIPGLDSFESHRTLAPKDKHAATKYRAPQSIEAITYHREFGEDRRWVFDIERVRARAAR